MAEQLLMWGMIDERALVNTDTRKARIEIRRSSTVGSFV